MVGNLTGNYPNPNLNRPFRPRPMMPDFPEDESDFERYPTQSRLVKLPPEGKSRVIICGVTPEIETGRFPAKGIIGESFAVEADIFADGHDEIGAMLLWRKRGDNNWRESAMRPIGNDRWRGEFGLADIGQFEYSIAGWVDPFRTWQRDLQKRLDAGQDVTVDMQIGAEMVKGAAGKSTGMLAQALQQWAERLTSEEFKPPMRVKAALSPRLGDAMAVQGYRTNRTMYHRTLRVTVDPVRARFSTWYEVFPRSCSTEPGRAGTFRDLVERLPTIAGMGFDVVYLPPIHPIGRSFRKGSNNTLQAEANDPGSPWAIGNEQGGHKAINPDLGTIDDFRYLLEAARKLGMEIALDISLQASPDHPYVKEHPDWFRKRPDGTIQYAENPPKKYQDSYPFDFDCPDWQGLWWELKGIFDYWIDMGVRIFRVDNPHTKPFAFWEWLIRQLKFRHPEVLLLSEAFTRPRVMYRLAQLGFSQSYTYFPWRTSKWELTQYLTELTQPPLVDFFRPNHWTNTPDVLIAYLQKGGRGAFLTRLVLAGTLGANYGMYGPAFELMENRPAREGSEEYLDSEKYQIREWDWNSPHSLKDFITLINKIRRENSALQSDRRLKFHNIDSEQLILFSKSDPLRHNVILTAVNLDPHHTSSGWTWLDLNELGVKPDENYQVHDLLSDARYVWTGPRNYIELNPQACPAHIFRIRRQKGEGEYE
jgi:starch synthase (maltosyl-transferring)